MFLFLFQFIQQYRHYQSNMQIFNLKPSQFSKTLDELLIFLAQVLIYKQITHFKLLFFLRKQLDYCDSLGVVIGVMQKLWLWQ